MAASGAGLMGGAPQAWLGSDVSLTLVLEDDALAQDARAAPSLALEECPEHDKRVNNLANGDRQRSRWANRPTK